jgi:maltooligosyltrehalose trehalohydrolase
MNLRHQHNGARTPATESQKPALEQLRRRLPVGAEVTPAGTHFRLWAPKCARVDVMLGEEDRTGFALVPEADGYFAGLIPGAAAGALYRFRLDGADTLCPDPVSRFQPRGPHGPSMVVDASRYVWRAHDWRGAGKEGQVLYEIHIGTFTPEGTWTAAAAELKHLAELGITVLEVMPVADFAGEFGWGYDGVNLFAPTRLYGTPDEMRFFVDEAHRLGLGVILDVVYNHFGPDGNYLRCFADRYFSTRHTTDWGEAINFDGADAAPVREFFLSNARYWIEEFRLDGVRLDATQDIHDDSTPHILAEIAGVVRDAAGGRETLIVAENEPQHTKLVRAPGAGGYGIDMLWNDDLHHSAMVSLTGRHEAYYTDYRGCPQEFISAAKYGYLYQGQYYLWQKNRRGTPAHGLSPASFVNFVQNHDQVANSGRGQRCHELAGAALTRAVTGLLLLMPGTPMLFQGQEFAASSPFFYFADHKAEIAALVAKGRAEFLSQFPSLATPEMQALLPDPGNRETFQRSKLKSEERTTHAAMLSLHRDLIALRQTDPVIRRGQAPIDGAVLDAEAFLLRYFADDGMDRLLLVNFGSDLRLTVAPEPLLAPPEDLRWGTMWSSEDPRYGGTGTPELDTDQGWHLPGRAAVLLRPAARETRA